MRPVFAVLASFAASGVEMVEALTIVLAVGLTRGWRATLAGVGAAVVVLAALIAVLGPTLRVIPLSPLRLVVGALLAIFGLQWLRKAVLRASGWKALHDEDAAFAEERRAAAATGRPASFDTYAFTVAFKGVALEGLEVVFIVLTLGASGRVTTYAAAGALAALVVVVGVGLAVRAPLARVPENTTKFVVGVLLTTFGTFWSGEGAGVHWPGGDVFILAVLAWTTALAFTAVAWLRRYRPAPAPAVSTLVGGGQA